MTKEEIAIEALHNIKNPIAYLRAEAEKEGNVLNGHAAISIANSPQFLMDIAERALTQIYNLPKEN
jgi:hypothetical protein